MKISPSSSEAPARKKTPIYRSWWFSSIVILVLAAPFVAQIAILTPMILDRHVMEPIVIEQHAMEPINPLALDKIGQTQFLRSPAYVHEASYNELRRTSHPLALLSHQPALEKKFLRSGSSISPRIESSGDKFKELPENKIKKAHEEPVSTF